MATKKTFEQWEVQIGVMVRGADAKQLKEKMTEEEFKDTWGGRIPAGVNHKDRTKFLKDNGYEVTRENMLNPELSVRSDSES